MTIGPVPIKRDAFLYMEGEGDKQCGTCWLFNPEGRCKIMSVTIPVLAGDSCSMYGYGIPNAKHLSDAPIYSPEVLGFVHREVRCENCFHFDKQESLCYLFGNLNNVTSPDNQKLFDLDYHVKAEGCCNAQTPRRSRVVT